MWKSDKIFMYLIMISLEVWYKNLMILDASFVYILLCLRYWVTMYCSYQIPPLVAGKTAVVISPLLSLMQDQVFETYFAVNFVIWWIGQSLPYSHRLWA